MRAVMLMLCMLLAACTHTSESKPGSKCIRKPIEGNYTN